MDRSLGVPLRNSLVSLCSVDHYLFTSYSGQRPNYVTIYTHICDSNWDVRVSSSAITPILVCVHWEIFVHGAPKGCKPKIRKVKLGNSHGSRPEQMLTILSRGFIMGDSKVMRYILDTSGIENKSTEFNIE